MSTVPAGARAAVITVSDRSAAGSRADLSGPLAAELLAGLGFSVAEVVVVADEVDDIKVVVQQAVSAGVELLS